MPARWCRCPYRGLSGGGCPIKFGDELFYIFQIARETLTNVARHAQARRVEVRLTYDDDMLELCLSDDGVGLSTPPSNGGQGLRNIRERTRLLNGMLDIDTAPNEGLTIVLTVPY